MVIGRVEIPTGSVVEGERIHKYYYKGAVGWIMFLCYVLGALATRFSRLRRGLVGFAVHLWQSQWAEGGNTYHLKDSGSGMCFPWSGDSF